MKRITKIAGTISVSAILSSCCWFKSVELQPSVQLAAPSSDSAKGGMIDTVAIGMTFQFRNWCPSRQLIKDVRVLEGYMNESVRVYATSEQNEKDYQRYLKTQEVYQKRIADMIANAQALAPREEGKIPATTVVTKETSQRAGEKDLAVTVTNEKSPQENAKAMVDAMKAPAVDAAKP
jgi:hypothetical protein